MKDKQNCPTAAGIVLYRIRKGRFEILGLTALPSQQRRCSGVYDFPKGQIDPGETSFDAAVRECYEETGLLPKRITAGPFHDETMVFWLGEVDADEKPVISTNPKTGINEHVGYKWITTEEGVRTCLDYLFQVAFWVKSELKKNIYSIQAGFKDED